MEILAKYTLLSFNLFWCNPIEVEQGVTLKIEYEISDLPGIERIYSDVNEAAFYLILEDLKRIFAYYRQCLLDCLWNYPDSK